MQCSVNERTTSASSCMEIDHTVSQNRFVNVKFEMPLTASHSHGRMVAEHPTTDHCHRFALSRVDLPRHNGRPRFVLGKNQLSEARPRSGTQKADVVRDLEQARCDCINRAVSENIGVV